MRKWYLKISLLLLLLFSMLAVAGHFDNTRSDDDNIRRIRNSTAHCDLDILFLGNSHTYAGINPLADTSLRMYNLGMPAGSVNTMALVFDNYCRSCDVPKTVAINIGPEMFCEESDRFTDYPIHRYVQDPLPHHALLLKGQITLPGYFLLVIKSYRKGLKNIFLDITGKTPPPGIDSLGFAPRYVVLDDSIETKQAMLYKPFREFHFLERKLDRYLGFIDLLQSKGIRVIVHEIPSNTYSTYFSRSFMQEYEAALEKIAAKNGVQLLKKEAFSLSPADFSDIDHLNSWGASSYTQQLLSKIQL